MFIIQTSVPNIAEAESLAVKLIAEKLAACVQILPPMTSVYVWEGKLQRESEHLLLIKTLPEKYDEVEAFITANHSYDVPEIVAINADKVSGPYFKWINETLS